LVDPGLIRGHRQGISQGGCRLIWLQRTSWSKIYNYGFLHPQFVIQFLELDWRPLLLRIYIPMDLNPMDTKLLVIFQFLFFLAFSSVFLVVVSTLVIN
jgi:hypothetical protein